MCAENIVGLYKRPETAPTVFSGRIFGGSGLQPHIAAQTKNGFRYLYYTPVATSSLGTETYVHHGVGATMKDGAWHTLTRNLEQDLKEAQPDNELQAVLGFLIRGSGRVDDVKTK